MIIDGHYWVEVDGKIVEDDNWLGGLEERFEVGNFYKYYKPAPKETQKIAIEWMYKRNEEKVGLKRDDPMFDFYFDDFDIIPRKCHINCLIILKRNPTGKIVFGSCGYKYPNGIKKPTLFCNRLPKNAVWWIFGFGKHKVINDYMIKQDNGVNEYFTIEK